MVQMCIATGFILTLLVAASSAQIYTAPLMYSNYEWLTQVSIGSPPQLMNLMVDTGSFMLWVAGPAMASTAPLGTFNPAASTSYAVSSLPAHSLAYGSATINITYFSDKLTFGGMTINNPITLGYGQSLVSGTSGYSGVMGVGYQPITACASNNNGCVLPSIFAAAGNATYYSLYMTSASNYTSGGMVIGGVDSTHYTGSINYVPMTPKGISGGSWLLNVSSITVGNTASTSCFDANTNGSCNVLIDSGTAAIRTVSTAQAVAILTGLGATQKNASLIDTPTTFNLNNWGWNCSATCGLPNLTFAFPGFTMVIPPSQYVSSTASCASGGNGKGWCTSVIGFTNYYKEMIIGNPILKYYYLVMDLGNSQIGFAPTV